MGHVNSFSTSAKNITLPSLTFSTTNVGNVVTSISMTPNANNTEIAFAQSLQKLGLLTLNGYADEEGVDNSTEIASTDTLSAALNKINKTFNTTKADIDDINTEIGNINTDIDGINGNIEDINTNISNINTKIDGINTNIGNINTSIEGINGDIEGINGTIDGLSLSMGVKDNTYVSAVTQAKGQIAVETKSTESITALGTIGTGTWEGTAIAPNHGGTGLEQITPGQVLIGANNNTFGFKSIAEINDNGTLKENENGLITGTVLKNYKIGGTQIAEQSITADHLDIESFDVSLLGNSINALLSSYTLPKDEEIPTDLNITTEDSILNALVKLELRIKSIEDKLNPSEEG